MKLYSVHDEQFKTFGRAVENPFFELFESGTKGINVPESGCSYLASVPAFETEAVLAHYRAFFGDMDVQIGYCWGRNDTLNALEWHKSSEVHCALEDMILLLGDMRDIKDGAYDTKNIKAFSVKKGESVEIYQTTLHFCPVLPCGGVFKNVVILPRGTNTPLTKPSDDKKLVARNKWLICHPECKKQTDLGRVAAITGENIKVR